MRQLGDGQPAYPHRMSEVAAEHDAAHRARQQGGVNMSSAITAAHTGSDTRSPHSPRRATLALSLASLPAAALELLCPAPPALAVEVVPEPVVGGPVRPRGDRRARTLSPAVPPLLQLLQMEMLLVVALGSVRHGMRGVRLLYLTLRAGDDGL